MNKLLITVAFLGLVTFSSAQKNGVPIWPGKVPNQSKAKASAVLDTQSEGGVIRITEVTNPTILKYPPTIPSIHKAVVVCPGGGYQILAYDKEGTEIAQWLASNGYTAYVLQYRVPGNELGALQDLQRAIRLVRSENGSINEVGVIGFSAGASLSARASTRFTEKIYEPVDKSDFLSCRPDFAMLIYPAYLDKGENRSLTPELNVDKDTPTTFIFQTADDPYGNSALVYAQAMRDNKASVELHFLPSGGHGYGLRAGKRASEAWTRLAEDWLRNK